MAIAHLPRVGQRVEREVVLLGSAFPERCVCAQEFTILCSWVWWHMSKIPGFSVLRQEGHNMNIIGLDFIDIGLKNASNFPYPKSVSTKRGLPSRS